MDSRAIDVRNSRPKPLKAFAPASYGQIWCKAFEPKTAAAVAEALSGAAHPYDCSARFMVTLGKSKIMVFYLSLLPSLLALDAGSLVSRVVRNAVMSGIPISVDVACVIGAVQMRRLTGRKTAIHFTA